MAMAPPRDGDDADIAHMRGANRNMQTEAMMQPPLPSAPPEQVGQRRARGSGKRTLSTEGSSRPVPDPIVLVNDPDLLNRIRELRAEVQDLQSILDSVRKGEAALDVYAPYISQTKDDIDVLMRDIRGGLNADAIRRIHNSWEKMRISPLLLDPTAKYDAKTQLNHLNMLDKQARELIFDAGLLTIPSRLQDWLDNSRPGLYIPFHAVFEDEMPSADDRTRLLNYIGWAPQSLQGGLIDVANGLVYRYAPSARDRWFSVLGVVSLTLVVTLGVLATCYVNVKEWPFRPEHVSIFVFSWVATLFGIAVHALVGNAKQAQSPGGSPPVIAPSEFLAHINVNYGKLLKLVGVALIVFFITVFAVGVSAGTPLATFFAGYSLDSVLGLGTASLDKQASAQAASLKGKLGLGS